MISSLKNLFLKNIGFRQTIIKNAFWLAVAEIATSLLRFILIIFAVRILGVTEYGGFAFALSFVMLLAIFGDLGLSHLITRDFAKEKEKEKEYPAIISLKIILGIGTVILIFIGSFFVTDILAVRKIIWILMVFIFFEGFFDIIYPLVRARQKMEYEAVAKIAEALLAFSVGIFLLLNFPSGINLSYAYLFASLIVLAIVAAYFHFVLHFLKVKWDVSLWIKFLKDAWPLMFGFVGVWMYLNLDSAMIGLLGNVQEVGWYNASSKVIFAIIFISTGLISKSFYPALSNFLRDSKEKIQRCWNYYMEIMISLALPLSVGGVIFAEKIISLLYGLDNYAPSVFIFQVLAILAGVTFLYYPFGLILVVYGQQKKNFILISIGFVLNVLLNFIFIPKYGFYSAPINTLFSSFVLLVLAIFLVRRYIPISFFNLDLLKSFIFSVFSSGVMLAVIVSPVVYNLHIFISIFVGFVVYGIIFLATKFLFKRFLLTK
jgi:O-antigen/teichoic acid export membrane protein